MGRRIFSPIPTPHRPVVIQPAIPTVLLAVALLFSGCTTVKEGHDPVIVNAERSQSIAFEAVNSFLKVEHANRAFYASKAPQIHEVAESIRKKAPRAFRSLRGAIQTYKANRSADNKATLETVLSVTVQLGLDASQWFAIAKSTTP